MRAWMTVVFMSAGLALAAQAPPPPPPSAQTVAQEAAQPAPLTLDECVSRALGESPVEASAEFSVQSAMHAAGAAKAPYYPSLGFNLVGSRWQRRIFLPASLSFPGQAPPTIVGPTDDYALSLNASYLLFDGGERKAQLATARARQKAAEADQGRVRQDLILAVHQAYFSLAAALAQREVAGQDLARAEDHLRIARDRKEAGTVPLVDVTRAASGVAQARLGVIRADNSVRKSRGRLATAMGLGASDSVDIAPGPEVPAPPEEAEFVAQETRALQFRPNLLAAAQSVEAAKQSVNQARGAFFPKVGAAAAYGHEDAAWYPEDKTWYIGVSVSVPIFTGFSRTENLAKARTDLGKAEADARQAALLVREQVWDAYSALRASYEAIAAARVLTEAARESQRLARERYAVGAGPLSDLLDAETALAGAEAAQVSAEWEYRSARSQFRWSAGDLTGR